jgi:hypothetical protein
MNETHAISREVNEFNTPLDDRYYIGLARDIIEDIHASLDEITFVRRLLSPNIRHVSQLDKDADGKIVIDVTDPHILEGMSFFTVAADHYRKHGCYTLMTPNKHPKSTYYLYWKEEKRRIKEGLVRDDGEWIPGDYYWYLNYCPIMLTKRINKESKRADRISDFANVWLGDYLFFHYKNQAEYLGQHIETLKCRGVGASFKMGSIGPRNALFKKKSKTFYVASNMQYLTKDGVLTKAWDYLDFNALNTPFPRLKLKDTQLEKRIGYKDVRSGAERGMKSDIIGLSTNDDPDKIRGKRGDIIFEEYGSYPHIKKAWNVSRDSVENGEEVFAQMCAMGTGGEEGADFEGAEDMFYHPQSYNIMPLQNVFDRNTEGKGECGFFWGSYMNRAGCYNADGMPDVTKALREIYVEFDKIRKSSSNPRILTQRRAEKAITPQDSMMRVDGTVFPVADIRDYLEKIMPNLQEFIGPHYVGDLAFDSLGKVAWRVGGYKQPIREFPLQDNKHEGAIEIFEMPHMTSGEAQRNRYIAGIDGYDDDASNTVSLGSIFILDLFTDRIVAEYTGRPKFANDFFEICRRMLIFYNAIGNYENDKKGMFGYFDRKNSLHLLSDTLQSLKDVEMVRGNLYGNKSKGTNSGRFINARARRLTADYMNTDAFGAEEGKRTLNLHKIRSIGLLLEALKWNANGNFDRISAAGMLMLLREDRQKFLENMMKSENERKTGMQFDVYFMRNSRGTLSYNTQNEKIDS